MGERFKITLSSRVPIRKDAKKSLQIRYQRAQITVMRNL